MKREACTELEWATRVELAACYRLMAHFGVSDLTYNHLSARVPDAPDTFLVKPTNFMFDEVTASSLLKFDFEGKPYQDGPPNRGGAHVIHAGVLQARPDLNAVFHTHTTANVGVSAQKHGLLMLSQHAMGFYKRIAYHDFGGFEFNLDQREPLLQSLGDMNYAILRNHGVLVCGKNLPQTFVDHHYLEMACRAQIAALSGGVEVSLIDEKVCERAAVQYQTIDPKQAGGKDWSSCLRLLRRLYPSFEE
jgi:ribulose-5-phosphate 4-epimerase/fuculose-1-phosphate aldolase